MKIRTSSCLMLVLSVFLLSATVRASTNDMPDNLNAIMQEMMVHYRVIFRQVRSGNSNKDTEAIRNFQKLNHRATDFMPKSIQEIVDREKQRVEYLGYQILMTDLFQNSLRLEQAFLESNSDVMTRVFDRMTQIYSEGHSRYNRGPGFY